MEIQKAANRINEAAPWMSIPSLKSLAEKDEKSFWSTFFGLMRPGAQATTFLTD